MDIETSIVRTCSRLLLVLSICIGSAHTHANVVVEAKPNEGEVSLSQYESFVLNALLHDVGLELDTQKKEKAHENPDKGERKPLPPPKIGPQPEPKILPEPMPGPIPAPVPKPLPAPEPVPEPEPIPEPKPDRWGFNKMRKDFQKDYSAVLAGWDERYQEVLSQWLEARKAYLQDEDKYLEATIDFTQLLTNETVSNLQKSPGKPNKLASLQSGNFHIIPNALNLAIKNQLFRGTCAAFAGVRAVETVLNQDEKLKQYQLDLSEQHFYWISKPTCIKAPCVSGRDSEGSTFDTGFRISQANTSGLVALRQEQYCPYQSRVNRSNLTYTPLKQCGLSGQFKVNKFNNGLRITDIITELDKNRPIAAGFKLTKSFFKTTGLVKARDPINVKNALGKHAGGHAVLLVGYIKLPPKYWAEEGKYCAIAANSWGAGYGKGGYACLSETWMNENRIGLTANSSRSVLSSLESVAILENSKI